MKLILTNKQRWFLEKMKKDQTFCNMYLGKQLTSNLMIILDHGTYVEGGKAQERLRIMRDKWIKYKKYTK